MNRSTTYTADAEGPRRKERRRRTSRLGLSGIPTLCILLSTLLVGCVGIPRETRSEDGPVRVIWEVEFIGNKALSDSELSKAIESLPTSLMVRLTRITLFGRYNILKPGVLKADLRRLRQLYRFKGYYNIRIAGMRQKVLAAPTPYRKWMRVRLEIRVVEGKQIRVKNLRIEGLDDFSHRKKVLGDLPIKPAGLFSTPSYRLFKGLLKKRLQDLGYAMAKLKGRVIVDKDGGAADVTLKVDPGPPCIFGDVRIKGNRQIPSSRIRRYFTFKKGETYSTQKMLDTQRALFALGVFSSVNFVPQLHRKNPKKEKSVPAGKRVSGKRPIKILLKLREDRFKLVKTGIGFKADGQRHQIEGTLSWTFLNFLGGLRTLELQFRPAYAFLPTLLDPQEYGPDVLGSADFKQPIYMDRLAELGVRLLYRRYEEAGPADFQKIMGTVSFSRPLFWRVSGRVSANIEYVFDLENPLTLERENYTLFFFEEQLVLDLRDNPLKTTRGLFASLTLQQAGLFGTFSYFKIAPEIRAFIPLPLGMVLAMRVSYGYMNSSRIPARTGGDFVSNSPVSQRFFSGGANSVRGWTSRFLGPLRCQVRRRPPAGKQTVLPGTEGWKCGTKAGFVGRERFRDLAGRSGALPPNDTSGGTPIPDNSSLEVIPLGGQHLLEGSVELRVPLGFVADALEDLGVVIFVDAGDLQGTVSDDFVFQFSAGGGLRYQTIIGAIRLDVGWRLNPDPVLHPLQDSWELHLSIGQAF